MDQSWDRSWDCGSGASVLGPVLGRVPGPVVGPVPGPVPARIAFRTAPDSSNRTLPVLSGLAPVFQDGLRLVKRKPARAVIEILVVVEDPWMYSARESNTLIQTAPDSDQPGQGPKSRTSPGPTLSDLGASRPKR